MNKYFLKNKYNLKIIEAWFCEDYKKIDEDYDILYLYGYREKVHGAKNNIQNTLILDITTDEDMIFSAIKKNVKYEINRCIKENILFKIYTSEDIKNDNLILDRFVKKYNTMYEQKGLPTRLNLNVVNEYIGQGNFIITSASSDDNDLCYHAYLTSSDSTRLLYSCSTFRSENQDEKNLVARANKFLHWEDIKYFKNSKILKYDFGGITSFDNPNGIDKFKMAFGGEKVKYYNVSYSKSFKGKLYLLIRRFYKGK